MLLEVNINFQLEYILPQKSNFGVRTDIYSLSATSPHLKTFILAKVVFIKTPFYLMVAARGLILP